MKKYIFIIITILIVYLPNASEALSYYCSEPQTPYCLDAYGTFDDKWSFERCKDEMEDFVRETNDYMRCVTDEAQTEAKKLLQEADDEASVARDQANDAVEKFNCRARGDSFCP